MGSQNQQNWSGEFKGGRNKIHSHKWNVSVAYEEGEVAQTLVNLVAEVICIKKGV